MMSRKYEKRAGASSHGSLAILIGVCLVLSGCARELTPFGRARKTDTIEAYEEFIRTSPNDPRVRFARDRIEVLRLLEAHRSGNATLAAPNRAASEDRTAVGLEPKEVRLGPWNLTAVPPRSSSFTLDLLHGSVAPVPHKLRIEQKGELVTYTLQYGSGPGRYYLTAGVPFASFRRLWAAVVTSDVGSYGPSYGRPASMADYRGNLTIEVDTGTERLSRTIRLEGSSIENESLRSILKSMADMHPEDHSMNFFR
ncbi:MAG: hypothetical protein JSW47_10310 [Phycisphaerales bacterium]|nr:MAG: hypothetical protein JSW47_10310 [Phycisphaerales bacterium]